VSDSPTSRLSSIFSGSPLDQSNENQAERRRNHALFVR
jgi:hypothetical protein